MRVIMYGSDTCPDCVEAKEKLAAAIQSRAIQLDFRDMMQSTKLLKEFLTFRDHDPMFIPVVQAGMIGIPFFITEGNFKTFEVDDLLGRRG